MLRRELLLQAVGGSVVCLTSGCGTLLYKERINRPHSRDIDWKIVALNGLGLLFFFVPGVIAFVIDFHTGAIYLPPEGYEGQYGQADAAPMQLRRVSLDRQQLNGAEIESRLGEHLGRPVYLDDPAVRVSPMNQIEEFQSHHQQHDADPSFGSSVRRFFGRLTPGK